MFSVNGAGGDDSDGVAAGDEVLGPVGEELGGGDDVGVEGLVDDEDAHFEMLSARSVWGERRLYDLLILRVKNVWRVWGVCEFL